jgi:hypothetical protein
MIVEIRHDHHTHVHENQGHCLLEVYEAMQEELWRPQNEDGDKKAENNIRKKIIRPLFDVVSSPIL